MEKMNFTERCSARGLGKGWIEKFKPKPVPISIEEISKSLHSVQNDLKYFSNALQLNCNNTNKKSHVDIVVPDEKPAKEQKSDIGFRDLLKKAVYANEFVPSSYNSFVPSDEKPSFRRQMSDTPEEIAQQVLMDHVMTLTDSPGDFDDVIGHLCTTLSENINTEDMMKESICIIFDQAMQYSNFSYSAARLLQYFDVNGIFKVGDGLFRKVFYSKCKSEFIWLQNNVTKDSVSPDMDKICNTAVLFGELFNNMTLKDKPNPVFKKVISDIVSCFLQTRKDTLIRCVVRLLKLVGPEIDRDRPKDVEDMFNRVRDFYLDPTNASLPDSLKSSIWNVYKLHTRDWDRCTSPAVTFQPSFEKYPLPVGGRKESRDSSLIDWSDYYQGEDETDYSSEGIDDDYEEFLRMSGQI